jgi:hypothetical protein
MDKINDFYKIIQNKYDQGGSINKNSIYDEILSREKDIKQIIDRVIEYKDQEKLEKKLFTNTKVSSVFLNTFKILNEVMDDLTRINQLSYTKLKKIVGKDQRQIYLGIFLVIIAIFLALIEVSDAL